MISLRSLCLLSVLALTSNALAETVAVSPPVNNGVDPKVALGMHQLIASEVEYFGDVESGVDLEQKPGSLTNGCLSSTSCLRTITNAAGTDWLVAGAIFNDGSNIKMDYLLYDKNVGKVIRRNTWIVPGDPSMMADAMTPVLRELLTGQSPEQD